MEGKTRKITISKNKIIDKNIYNLVKNNTSFVNIKLEGERFTSMPYSFFSRTSEEIKYDFKENLS